MSARRRGWETGRRSALWIAAPLPTGDWSITDFTVAELKQWIGGTTYDAAALRPSALNGQYPVLTMQEIIDLAKAKSALTGRTITVYPETGKPLWVDLHDPSPEEIARACDDFGLEIPPREQLEEIEFSSRLQYEDGVFTISVCSGSFT